MRRNKEVEEEVSEGKTDKMEGKERGERSGSMRKKRSGEEGVRKGM